MHALAPVTTREKSAAARQRSTSNAVGLRGESDMLINDNTKSCIWTTTRSEDYSKLQSLTTKFFHECQNRNQTRLINPDNRTIRPSDFDDHYTDNGQEVVGRAEEGE